MYSYILSCIAFFILAIASINFVNLTVARSVKRAKEIGIRKVIGGDRSSAYYSVHGRIIRIVRCCIFVCYRTCSIVLPTFNQLSNKALSPAYMFDLKLIVGIPAAIFIDVLFSGILPSPRHFKIQYCSIIV